MSGRAAGAALVPADEAARRTASDRVMGTDVDVIVDGPGPGPEAVIDRLRALERRWSRFLDDSELSRIGRAGGAPVVTSTETAMLVERAVHAALRSRGRFDPTVLDALEAAGYDRDFDELRGAGPDGPPVAPSPAPGTAGIRADAATGLVIVPAGRRLDPGGIGKGLAADLAAVEAVDAGATGVLVSVGGDLRVAGQAPAEGWEIEVDHHRGPPARVNLRSGALATSSTLQRRWDTPSGPAHHVIDPRTGRPSAGPAVSVSVLADEAWWAEALTTTLLVGFGEDDLDAALPALLDGAGALVTTGDGATHRLGTLGHAFSVADGRSGSWVPIR